MSLQDCFTARSENLTPLLPLTPKQLAFWLQNQTPLIQQWVSHTEFNAAVGCHCAVPDEHGGIARVLYGVTERVDIWTLSDAPSSLPSGGYQLETDWTDEQIFQVALGWGLGAYQFTRYKDVSLKSVALKVAGDREALATQVTAICRVRDLINTPPDDMMPPELAAETKQLARSYGASFSQIVGDDLLDENYPAIHAVGRASVHAPRLLQLEWGASEHPQIVLVGKGVCFDSGGLDLKPSKGMRYMQKDMGGAAHVLGLAELIMAAGLPVQLRVLIPAVENAVSGNAFHPGDILQTRSGLMVEIENTDAEGRLVLGDALTEACSQSPDLVIDFATLTGAARVAVGTEIACFFSNNDSLARLIQQQGAAVSDPTWQLPLFEDYAFQINSRVADLLNCSTGPFGGAITAALYLQRFVSAQTDWLHFDVMAWNNRKRPGRPEGGEAMGIRAVFEVLRQRYG